MKPRGPGADTLGGIQMLVYQGAASFEMWTQQDAPVDRHAGGRHSGNAGAGLA